MSRLDDAIRSYDAEVEAEAVKLIEGGMPPFDAMEQARSNVRVRRMQKVRDDENANTNISGDIPSAECIGSTGGQHGND